jgi:leader peptidase (prepilin peptidase)/N-methyltransferase
MRTGPRPSRTEIVWTTLVVVVLFIAVVSVREDGIATIGHLALAWGLVVGTVIDLRRRILPNRLTFKLPALVGIPLVAESIRLGTWDDLVRALIAAVLLPLGMFLFSELFRLIRGQTGMGLGDVKLAVSLGLGLGWFGGWELFIFGYAAVGVAMAVALALVVMRRAKLASRIPFGPYLAAGAVFVLIFGDPAVDWLTNGLLR